MEIIQLSHPNQHINTITKLPASKSESNRALIIKALAGDSITLDNISEARDTQTMIRMLGSAEHELNVLDAGTTMRFLTAYLTVTNQNRILTGTPRMQERPISILVNALRQLGGQITYVNNEGFPPLHIQGFRYAGNKQIKIKGDVSSQYISALLMVAPLLPDGLELELEGKVGSRPYIAMTLDLMKHFGIASSFEGNLIKIAKQDYIGQAYTIESDWSGASYWFSMAALAAEADIYLPALRANSLQGDRAGADLMRALGVAAAFDNTGVRLTKADAQAAVEIDFTHCPDLAQTFAVLAAAKGIRLTLTGLESLRIKETDRIAAIQNELRKFGADMAEIAPDRFEIVGRINTELPTVTVHTYDDHRMAMAFAPLALLMPIRIEEPGVVAKSYPRFWEDLEKAGFIIDKV